MKNRQTERLIHLIKRKIESYKDFCVSPGVYEIKELGVPNKATIVFRAITSLGFPSNEMIVPLKVLELNQSKLMVITFVNNPDPRIKSKNMTKISSSIAGWQIHIFTH